MRWLVWRGAGHVRGGEVSRVQTYKHCQIAGVLFSGPTYKENEQLLECWVRQTVYSFLRNRIFNSKWQSFALLYYWV